MYRIPQFNNCDLSCGKNHPNIALQASRDFVVQRKIYMQLPPHLIMLFRPRVPYNISNLRPNTPYFIGTKKTEFPQIPPKTANLQTPAEEAVELEIMQQARMTLAKSPPGTT